MLGISYEVRPAHLDEKSTRDDDPQILTRRLSEAKAERVAGEFQHAVIVSGDAVAAKGISDPIAPRSLDVELAKKGPKSTAL